MLDYTKSFVKTQPFLPRNKQKSTKFRIFRPKFADFCPFYHLRTFYEILSICINSLRYLNTSLPNVISVAKSKRAKRDGTSFVTRRHKPPHYIKIGRNYRYGQSIIYKVLIRRYGVVVALHGSTHTLHCSAIIATRSIVGNVTHYLVIFSHTDLGPAPMSNCSRTVSAITSKPLIVPRLVGTTSVPQISSGVYSRVWSVCALCVGSQP